VDFASEASEVVPLDMSDQLQLGQVRSELIRQEDTIIFNLIERAQSARNEAVYQPGAIPVPGGLWAGSNGKTAPLALLAVAVHVPGLARIFSVGKAFFCLLVAQIVHS